MEFETESIQDRPRPASAEERRDAHEVVHTFARPRMTGTPEAAEVEDELRERLDAIGYEIHELPFHFSAWPGRYGIAVAGALIVLASALAMGRVLNGHGPSAIGVLLTGALALYGMARFAPRMIDRLPWDRRESANWYVQRPGASPRFLIVAHRDSKSQTISTYLRSAAGGLAGLGWGGLLLLAAGVAVDPAWSLPPLIAVAGGLSMVGGALLLYCRSENHSPGALDNATGLAALLGIARREREHDDIAFLITDAEELGLAGAHAVAHRLPPIVGVINLDGLDDEGPIYIIERFGLPRRGLAPHLAAAHLRAAAELDLPAARRDLPLGVGVDHIPFTRAGHPSLTLMRGHVRALRRVHRPEDTAERVTGAGAADVAALVSSALRLLRDTKN